MGNCIAVGLGGFLGSLCRYGLSLIPLSERLGFPVMTLAINLAGSLILGLLDGLVAKHAGVSAQMMLFLRVGVCGGFTTFSTFALETTRLIESGKILSGLAYAVLSVLFGVLAAGFGRTLV